MDDEAHDSKGNRPDHDIAMSNGPSERNEPRTEQSLLEDEADPPVRTDGSNAVADGLTGGNHCYGIRELPRSVGR